jgi:hypothetical protein
MTMLLEDRTPRFQEKYEILAATELSSRPERSVVERSAVSFLGSPCFLPYATYFSSRTSAAKAVLSTIVYGTAEAVPFV